jgi:hypothetical protein
MKEQRRLAQESLIPFHELKSLKDQGDAAQLARSLKSVQSSQSGR